MNEKTTLMEIITSGLILFSHVTPIINLIPVPRVCLSTDRLVALPVVVVILLEASSSDSRKLVVSRSELSIELDS
jgi:hypothetical protein